MDLTSVLLRFAARVPHVLLVPVPGCPGLRMDAERAIALRGWREATSPADADVLLVAGRPGPELHAVVAGLWRRVPAPRLRVDLADAHAADLERVLGRVPAGLADVREARAQARAAVAVTDTTEDGSSAGNAGAGAHGGDGHHHMDMPLPGGLSMADLAEDRDGLALDLLHLPLGPALPDWPAGLVVDVEMQGDVIVSAAPRVLDAGFPAATAPTAIPAAARDLDALARVLAVAGWAGPAARARDARDRMRVGGSVDDLAGLVRAVRRSRVLHLMLRQVETGAGLDVAGLLADRLARIEARAGGAVLDEPVRTDVADLGPHLAGAELASARLVVAALAPDVDAAAAPTRVRDAGEER